MFPAKRARSCRLQLKPESPPRRFARTVAALNCHQNIYMSYREATYAPAKIAKTKLHEHGDFGVSPAASEGSPRYRQL